MEVNEGLSSRSLQLCPAPTHPPGSWSPRKGAGCLLQVGVAAAPVGVSAPLPSPPPHDPSLRAGGRLQQAGGKALPYGARGPGDCRSLCVGWGWDLCPVAMGAAPRILHTRRSLGSGVESHWPGSCSLHVGVRAAVSWPVPPAWHHVPSHPAPSGP